MDGGETCKGWPRQTQFLRLVGDDPDQLEEIFDSVTKKKMPISSYLWIHPDARLSPADHEMLQNWVDGKLTTDAN